MVKLTNPQYEYPLPIETYFNGFYNSSPKYSDDGRVSMYSENGKDWNDVSELSYVTGGYTLCTTGFCLSAFTNPLPESRIASENVRFSIIEGPVALGSKLELSGADEIWYSIDGGAAIRYTKPIILEKSLHCFGVEQDGRQQWKHCQPYIYKGKISAYGVCDKLRG